LETESNAAATKQTKGPNKMARGRGGGKWKNTEGGKTKYNKMEEQEKWGEGGGGAV
jgi:hypothetical protein